MKKQKTIKLPDITGRVVEIDATVFASKVDEICEANGLGCSETEWLIECLKEHKE